MKPEEMRTDIPEDVREALAAVEGTVRDDWFVQLFEAIRAKPKTVRLSAAELPAPLTQVPESGSVWTIVFSYEDPLWQAFAASQDAVNNGFAFATREDAEAWLHHMQSWRTRPGEDWTPHTPGDPMPCDGDAVVKARLRDSDRVIDAADDLAWGRIPGDEGVEITAWRYAREDEG